MIVIAIKLKILFVICYYFGHKNNKSLTIIIIKKDIMRIAIIGAYGQVGQ
jgi:hypothetical protein